MVNKAPRKQAPLVKVMKEWNKVARIFDKKADDAPSADMGAQHQQ